MKNVFSFIKKYYLFPFLVVFSYLNYESYSNLFSTRKYLFLQVAFFIVATVLVTFLAKTSKKLISHISAALIGALSQVYICLKTNSIENIYLIKADHENTFKFLVVLGQKVLSNPFNAFLLITSIGAFITIIYLEKTRKRIDSLSYLFLTSGFSAVIVAGVLGEYSPEYLLLYPLSMSAFTLRLYNLSFSEERFGFHRLFDGFVLITVIYNIAAHFILNNIIF